MEPRQKIFLITSSIWELENFYQKKKRNIYIKLFERWDPKHLEIDENFNDELEDNVGDEGMQNPKDD